MTDVFGRRYSLVIGRLASSLIATAPQYVADSATVRDSLSNPTISGSSVELDYRTEPESFIKITDLNIKADIVYTKEVNNKGGTQNNTIEVHNLSKESKAKIREDDLIFLKAGYVQDIPDNGDEDDLPLVFAGQVIFSSSSRGQDGTNVTTLVCGDNIIPKRAIKVSEAWLPGTGLSQVILDLLSIAAANGIPTGRVFGLSDVGSPLSENVYTYGYSISGTLFDEIQKICDSIDFIFYTNLGKIFIEPKGEKLNSELYEFILLDELTLKKPIEYVLDSSKSQGKDSRSGIRTVTFLNGSVTADKIVNISSVSDEFNGDYTVKSVRHSLDFEGANWDTTVDCARVI